VWLIGLDGASWELMTPMIERGELPEIGALMERGAHGVLRSEEPLLSPALWNTVATGMPRCVHGVVSFVVKLPGSYRIEAPGPPDRASPALWELVGSAGGRSAVVNWYASFPAERIEGIYVSQFTDPGSVRQGQVEPRDFAATLESAEPPMNRTGEFETIARNEHLRRTLTLDAQALAVLRTAVDGGPSQLVAAYFNGIDVVEHVCWRHMDPASQAFPQDGEAVPELAEVIPAYYRFTDELIGSIVAMAPPDATLVIVSDHGHGPMRVQEAFHLQIQVLLETIGLLDGNRGEVFTIDQVYRPEKWIWLNLEGVEEAGVVPVAEARQTTARVAARLRGLRTDRGEPVLDRVVDHSFEETWRAGDPALTVRFSPAMLLAERIIDGETEHDAAPIRLRHTDVSGSHRPEGIVILAGPGIRRGVRMPEADLFQVAPTVLYLLGMPQDARMLSHAPATGGVMVEAIDPRLLERHPIRMIPGYPGTDRTALLRRNDADGIAADPNREETLERLRALGYLR
jgi:predicted AlkP superfamily phosphohydrolase/phosphomutase